MKKYYALLALAGILLATGCSSGNVSTDSSNAIAPAPSEYVKDLAGGAETETAFLTTEVPSESETPPQMMITYSGNGVACASVMTLGSSEWEYGGKITASCSAGVLRAYADGLITATVDLDLVSENEPKIQLWNGAEITGATLYTPDDSDIIPLSYTADGTIFFPNDVYSGVAAISLSFEQGNAEYYFAVTRSQTDPSQPPELLLYFNDTDDYGWRMTKGGYTWTVEKDGEAWTTTVDLPSPRQMADDNKLRYSMTYPGQPLKVGLPENSRIVSAVMYTSEDESVPLEYTGNTITAPEGGGAVCITVEMPAGTCDYLFQLLTCGTEGEPAGASENAGADCSVPPAVTDITTAPAYE